MAEHDLSVARLIAFHQKWDVETEQLVANRAAEFAELLKGKPPVANDDARSDDDADIYVDATNAGLASGSGSESRSNSASGIRAKYDELEAEWLGRAGELARARGARVEDCVFEVKAEMVEEAAHEARRRIAGLREGARRELTRGLRERLHALDARQEKDHIMHLNGIATKI